MEKATIPSRRSFITIAGAALSAPLAGTGIVAAAAGDDLQARLARFEDGNAIRALTQAWFANPASLQIDPAIRAISAQGFVTPDEVVFAEDGHSATARIDGTATIETAIGPDCPLVQMAREQGGGVLQESRAVAFVFTFVRQDGGWAIERVEIA